VRTERAFPLSAYAPSKKT